MFGGGVWRRCLEAAFGGGVSDVVGFALGVVQNFHHFHESMLDGEGPYPFFSC